MSRRIDAPGKNGQQEFLSLGVKEVIASARAMPRSPHRDLTNYNSDFTSAEVGRRGLIVHTDCFEWLRRAPEASIQAVVTDPPYGVKEFEADQLTKRKNGVGGIWRLGTVIK